MLRIQKSTIPEEWNPNPSDQEFNDWMKYIAGRRVRRKKPLVNKWYANKLKVVA